jgi:DNA-directed RNA polymerase delta subunit
MSALSFQPSTVTKSLRSGLTERANDVITSRYGLGSSDEPETLESIGDRYDITRERVRQIESDALRQMRDSDTFDNQQEAFSELEELFHDLGVILREDTFLDNVSNRTSTQNHIFLLLDLDGRFNRERSDDHFHHRWHVDQRVATAVHEALQNLHKSVSLDELISEVQMLERLLQRIKNMPSDHEHHLENEEVLRRWLEISRKIAKNPLGEWGHAESPNVNIKGVRDYAYLVIRQHGNPLHFREVTERISEMFDKEAHEATTHNELIKDDRFVLVGRGLYALKEWGYMTGVVREVIEKVLENEGPLERDEIIDKVLKERYVKPNTVVVNLQDNDHFRKNEEGKYELAE